MIKCIFAAAAKSIVRDVDTNNVSVFNVYEQVRPKSFPVLLANFQFIASFRRETGDPDSVLHTVIIALNGEKLYSDKMSSEFKGQTGSRLILRFNGLVVSKPGILTITLTDEKGVIETEYSIEVTALPSQMVSSASVSGLGSEVPDQLGEEPLKTEDKTTSPPKA